MWKHSIQSVSSATEAALQRENSFWAFVDEEEKKKIKYS